jgi:hypothetical protein
VQASFLGQILDGQIGSARAVRAIDALEVEVTPLVENSANKEGRNLRK